jgi:hypothetical protein
MDRILPVSSSLLAVFCCLLTTILPAPANDDAKPDTDKRERPKVAKEGLRQELLKRTREDQDARKKLIELTSRRHAENDKTLSESAEFKSLRDIDRKNTAWLKMVVTAHGWPGKSAVGEDGAQAAWLLVQHADHDRDFQKQCLKPIEDEANVDKRRKEVGLSTLAEYKKILEKTYKVSKPDKK